MLTFLRNSSGMPSGNLATILIPSSQSVKSEVDSGIAMRLPLDDFDGFMVIALEAFSALLWLVSKAID